MMLFLVDFELFRCLGEFTISMKLLSTSILLSGIGSAAGAIISRGSSDAAVGSGEGQHSLESLLF